MINYIYYDPNFDIEIPLYKEFICDLNKDFPIKEHDIKALCVFVAKENKVGICSFNIVENIITMKLISKVIEHVQIENSLTKGLQEIPNFKMPTNEIYIQNLTDFMNITLSISANEKLYRGQADKNWNLEPSFKRGKNIENKEAKIYIEIQQANHSEFISDDYINNACNMQHYGVPTRLLDWTENSLHSIYFACVNEENIGKDGTVLLVDSPQIHNIDATTNDKISDFLKYKYLENTELKDTNIEYLAKLSDEKKRYLFFKTKYYNNRIKSQKGCFSIYFEQTSEEAKEIRQILFNEFSLGLKNKEAYRKVLDGTLDLTFKKIKRTISALHHSHFENTKFLRELEECFTDEDVLEYEIIQKTVEHLKKLFNIKEVEHQMDDILKYENTLRIHIESKYKEEIIKHLDLIGINSSTVYPDIQGLVSYLKERYSSTRKEGDS